MPPTSLFNRNFVDGLDRYVAESYNDDKAHSPEGAKPWVILLIIFIGGTIAAVLLGFFASRLWACVIVPLYELVRYKIPPAWRTTKETVQHTIPAAVDRKMRERKAKRERVEFELGSQWLQYREYDVLSPPTQAYVNRPAHDATTSRMFENRMPRRMSTSMDLDTGTYDPVWYEDVWLDERRGTRQLADLETFDGSHGTMARDNFKPRAEISCDNCRIVHGR